MPGRHRGVRRCGRRRDTGRHCCPRLGSQLRGIDQAQRRHGRAARRGGNATGHSGAGGRAAGRGCAPGGPPGRCVTIRLVPFSVATPQDRQSDRLRPESVIGFAGIGDRLVRNRRVRGRRREAGFGSGSGGRKPGGGRGLGPAPAEAGYGPRRRVREKKRCRVLCSASPGIGDRLRPESVIGFARNG